MSTIGFGNYAPTCALTNFSVCLMKLHGGILDVCLFGCLFVKFARSAGEGVIFSERCCVTKTTSSSFQSRECNEKNNEKSHIEKEMDFEEHSQLEEGNTFVKRENLNSINSNVRETALVFEQKITQEKENSNFNRSITKQLPTILRNQEKKVRSLKLQQNQNKVDLSKSAGAAAEKNKVNLLNSQEQNSARQNFVKIQFRMFNHFGRKRNLIHPHLDVYLVDYSCCDENHYEKKDCQKDVSKTIISDCQNMNLNSSTSKPKFTKLEYESDPPLDFLSEYDCKITCFVPSVVLKFGSNSFQFGLQDSENNDVKECFNNFRLEAIFRAVEPITGNPFYFRKTWGNENKNHKSNSGNGKFQNSDVDQHSNFVFNGEFVDLDFDKGVNSENDVAESVCLENFHKINKKIDSVAEQNQRISGSKFGRGK